MSRSSTRFATPQAEESVSEYGFVPANIEEREFQRVSN